MSETDDSLYGDSVYEAGVEDAEDFDPAENLTGDGVGSEDREEPYDTGYSPPEHRPVATRYGTTDREQAEGESLDQRLAEEEPDVTDVGPDFPGDDDFSEAEPRAGRLVAPDEGAHDDEEAEEIAVDAGRAGSAASAEEAAVHVVSGDPADDSLAGDDLAGDSILESDDVDR
jgi:hypothetical protein